LYDLFEKNDIEELKYEIYVQRIYASFPPSYFMPVTFPVSAPLMPNDHLKFASAFIAEIDACARRLKDRNRTRRVDVHGYGGAECGDGIVRMSVVGVGRGRGRW